MSLLGDLVGSLSGGGSEGGSQSLLNSVMEMVNNHPGGLSGLLQSFHDQGLGGLASSWVGTGQNLPVSAEQIQNVLGNEQVQQYAQKLGIPPGLAGGQLAQLLPALIDHLTPNGEAPQGGILSEGLSALSGLLKGNQPA